METGGVFWLVYLVISLSVWLLGWVVADIALSQDSKRDTMWYKIMRFKVR